MRAHHDAITSTASLPLATCEVTSTALELPSTSAALVGAPEQAAEPCAPEACTPEPCTPSLTGGASDHQPHMRMSAMPMPTSEKRAWS